MKILIVMIGGFLGSISRFGIGKWLMTDSSFPTGTFVINIIGCFALGWLLTTAAMKKNIPTNIVLLAGTGFLGSFTTFSTFSVETIKLIHSGMTSVAVLYVLGSIFIGLLFTFFGWKTALLTRREGGEA
ncbi:fluoride efflux transporter CrcB [Bacillus sp. DNRA2]|uniref:fluoride efflux transporter CrcB n=1 Tax=Bacillus sp. DNRA2 TaxID=2723053 RepID=UPI00145FA18C|nr:fluoride efflux transporter CrcB [Bacillus sp. DNRA2]NMD69146.1 fluoride efflux transporter CrcB [Bacillus sp. DNRA2]